MVLNNYKKTMPSVSADQQIVEEYFNLVTNKSTKEIAWLYGMVATYGLKPSKLIDFTWNDDLSINIKDKKKPIKAIHPQWVFLFSLKEKDSKSLNNINNALLKIMAINNTTLNIVDLLEAHNLRKKHYKTIKKKQRSLVSSNLS